MSITLYGEPNFKRGLVTFDPKNTKYIYLTSADDFTAPIFKLMDTLIVPFPYNESHVFNIASVKNESDEYFIIINNIFKKYMDTVQGSVSNTGFKDNIGYIQTIKKINVNNYKTGMIVFIGLFFALVILIIFLFFTVYIHIKLQTTQNTMVF